ncbi:hypothetical protein BC629DRAFT_428426 [Irpex lacteus]|nr:hypothetical protein BC629DRAFT_428426 [Irpex lacteus]
MSTSLSVQALSDGDNGGGRSQGSLPFATQASTIPRTMLPIIPRPDKDRGYDVSKMDYTLGPEFPSRVPRTNSLYSKRGTQPDTDELHSPRSRYEKGHGGALTADVDQGSSKEDCKAQDQQDHVCGCQSQRLTGWAAAEKTLTDLDQREVGGFKEDIDSLLTFAGLYSGVLTAFVIVSFTQLQEDTAGETLNVLRIIANQTTNAAATVLTAPPPFHPSLAAKRVNVLWFASLIISLSTASLAILAKQWLRGYMAFASSSPQGQLRIRHFRRSGLETWRVFGIVSMLPLLLQISLALFFVGLCFFTADIDPVIGNTALPLVCAWAFLFITVTVSPIFSARCPYKTPALLAITTALRVHVWCKLRHYARAVLAISAGILFLSFLKVLKIIRDIFGIWKDFVGAYQDREDDVINKMTAIIKEEISSQEEAESLNKPSNDLIILLSADAAQANLELDLVIMEDALKHSSPRWDEVVHFLVQIVGNRTPLLDEFTEGPQTSLIDCRLLSARTRAGIMGLLSQYVANSDELASSNAQNIGSSWDSLGPAKQWTICMFLSLREPDSDQMPGVLHPLFAAWFGHFALRNAFSSGWQFHLVFPPQEVTLLCLWIKLGYDPFAYPAALCA